MSQVGLHVRPGPFLRTTVTTPTIMRDVLLALLPLVAASIWYFGASALLVLVAASLGCALTEWAVRVADEVRFEGAPDWAMVKQVLGAAGSLRDGSALLTGVLLALTLPPALPLWMAFLGGVVSIGLGKAIWGGLGQNLFNPALVGRAFLQSAFPIAITTWTPPGEGIQPASLAAPLMHVAVDGVTSATPLNLMKFDHQATDTVVLFIGDHAGSLGETSGLLIVLAGLWLLSRRAFDWRIPVAILGSVAVFSALLWGIDPASYPTPWFMLGSGGLLFGAVFMATDPVTSPMAPRGALVFGAGVGLLVVLIRLFGGLPEGVMYSILLMNAVTPLINRAFQPRPFGRS